MVRANQSGRRITQSRGGEKKLEIINNLKAAKQIGDNSARCAGKNGRKDQMAR
jgi:hypothetical protein